MNPLYGQQNNNRQMANVNNVNNVNDLTQNIANTINFIKSFQSPQAFMDYLQKNNPQLAQQVTQLGQTISNPQQYAMNLLTKQGVDLQQLNKMIN